MYILLKVHLFLNVICGHAMAEAVSCHPVTTGNGFNPKPAHVGFVADKVTLELFFGSTSVSRHQSVSAPHLCIYH